LIQLADRVVVTTPDSLPQPALIAKSPPPVVILPALEAHRLMGVRRRRPQGLRVGYLGSLDFGKLHPRFAAMNAAVAADDVNFVIAGAGPDEPELHRQIRALNTSERYVFRGWVDDVREFFSSIDVLGFPAAETTYGTADLAVQEALWAGVPPVVLAGTSCASLVRHRRTGLVVDGEAEYANALRWLRDHPLERRRMGRNAKRFAQAHLHAGRSAAAWRAFYGSLLEEPRRARAALPAAASGAHAFVQSLGSLGAAFLASLGRDTTRARAADLEIAEATSALGTLLQYCQHAPDSPHLRFWCGLILERRGRPALAAASFHAALELGLRQARVREALVRVFPGQAGTA
jgi:hypothetical protein